MICAIVGPSGAGKDTLIAGAKAAMPELHVVRRVITRPTEAGGEDFEGVSQGEFDARKKAGDFALSWEAHGLSYGIPVTQTTGPAVIFNGSRAILEQAKRVFPDLRVILVTAPSAVLAERLAARGRETASDIEKRLQRAQFSLPEGIDATVVCNDGTEAEGIQRLISALQPVRA